MGECHEITKITKYIFLWFSNDFLGLIFASFQFYHKANWKVPMVSTIPNLGKCQYILIIKIFWKIHITIMQVHKALIHIHMNILQTHMTIQQIHIKTITYYGMCQVYTIVLIPKCVLILPSWKLGLIQSSSPRCDIVNSNVFLWRL